MVSSSVGMFDLWLTNSNTPVFVPLILWQMGFFRRRYREIIEAEKNRKDSDESWDWMEKNHWDLQWGGVPEEPMRLGIGSGRIQ